MSEVIRPGWVGFRHAITGDVRALNPHDVEAIRALKRERHPRQWSRPAWEQVALPTRTKPWDWRQPDEKVR